MSRASFRWLAVGLLPALSIAYPFVVFVGLRRGDTRTLALVLLVLLAVTFGVRMATRARGTAQGTAWSLAGPVLAVTMVGLGLVLGHDGPIKSVPVLVSGGLLLAFAWSLTGKETLVERFARRYEGGTLSPAQVQHCRQVTWAWCIFFVLNIAVTLALAFWAPLSWWSLYTGVIAYVLMGGMFAAELGVRTARFGRRGRQHGALDR